MSRLVVGRIAALRGSFLPPSDKSLTHRALLLAAKANGPSRIVRPLDAEDCRSTARCLSDLGTQVFWGEGEVRVSPRPWTRPGATLDCGNSGTTMRLLAGWLAGCPWESTLDGDASLRRRPMGRIAMPLRQMGCRVEGERPPITLRGTAELQSICYESPVASAQVKSCVLFAGLQASGETWVSEPSPSRDHTERMLEALGVPVLRNSERPTAVGVRGGAEWRGFEMVVPGDFSSAAFFLVAGAIVPQSSVVGTQVVLNPLRTGLLEVFRECGVPFRVEGGLSELGEPWGDVAVEAAGPYRPFRISGDLVPRMVDEIPIAAVLATQCDGWSEIRDAEELRVKESDRIERVAEGLRNMGATVETFADGMRILGPCRLHGATISADGDHRIAMAFAVAGLVAEGQTVIEGAEAIGTSYPAFEEELWRLAVV
ncbi:MAG: 3-phosphoshikimate 1-carboxyvinyltransferase [Fimbriimonadales bacterium]|nr:3-phosphoshikimate 1-carboxyvinyltransferase [Fimbriimonadales bacterium]